MGFMRKVIFLFFFLSGFSALVYEVAWVRLLALTLGNTAYATSTVLAVFMGGLAAGAWFGGKLADKFSTGHLRRYGLIELLVGVVAPLVTFALAFTPSLYAGLIDANQSSEGLLLASRLLIAGVLLVIPCLLMGATLPVLVRYVEEYESAQEVFANLYGFNTIGAAVGALCTCFLGFTYIGLNGTVLSAAVINLLIGLLAMRFGATPLDPTAAAVAAPTPEIAAEPAPAATESSAKGNLFSLLLLSALTGFTALSYEVIWTRMLSFYLGSVTYTFTTMVATFLLGLALGSFIFRRFLHKKGEDLSRSLIVFATAQYLAAFLAVITLFTMPMAGQIRGIWFLHDENTFLAMMGKLAFTVFAVILPPATAIGALFPALGTLAAGDKKHVASSVGRIYAANTIGCVVGSMGAGLLLLPLVGFFGSIQILAVVSFLTGAIAAFKSGKWKNPLAVVSLSVPIVVSVLFATLVHWSPGINPQCKLLFAGEDALGTVYIVDDPRMKGKTIVFNGSCLATTLLNSLRYMRMLGHLPALLHPDPKTGLIGCFGTGSTSGALSMHPELSRVDIVELSSMILKQNKLFAKENYNVVDNPKVHTHINDVRNYLLCTKDKYDIVTFEPPPPIDAGIVNLYTKEFYELVKNRLNPGGMMCQWVPTDVGSKSIWKMMVLTATTVFPHVSLWLPSSHEAIILASDKPITIDFQRMQKRIDASPQIAESLKGVGLDDAMAIAATYLVSGKELEDYLSDALPITDDHPRLEFFMPFLDAKITDLEMAEPGKKQIETIFIEAQKAKGFDADRFRRCYTVQRLLEQTQYSTLEKGTANLNAAVKLLPNNTYLMWVQEHVDLAVSGQI